MVMILTSTVPKCLQKITWATIFYEVKLCKEQRHQVKCLPNMDSLTLFALSFNLIAMLQAIFPQGQNTSYLAGSRGTDQKNSKPQIQLFLITNNLACRNAQ